MPSRTLLLLLVGTLALAAVAAADAKQGNRKRAAGLRGAHNRHLLTGYGSDFLTSEGTVADAIGSIPSDVPIPPDYAGIDGGAPPSSGVYCACYNSGSYCACGYDASTQSVYTVSACPDPSDTCVCPLSDTQFAWCVAGNIGVSVQP
ncbi:rhizobactin transporter [Chlorella sorokiniana]|uniref:Rhizobactin transporter n=1 Tax=Chlorella sorokiniana TaxID=3076 RepID=A0A2P6U0E5_CHLSO|nr:rhizobactin transporter [Chlorella sorokiniana]|eukprot:PRW59795.1 rhizobactin transporter [Chlorella sorokiniana]